MRRISIIVILRHQKCSDDENLMV